MERVIPNMFETAKHSLCSEIEQAICNGKNKNILYKYKFFIVEYFVISAVNY